MKIVVVGGGMQGRVIAKNLREREESPEVTVADLREPAGLPEGVKFASADVLDESQVRSLMAGTDAAVLAVPSSIARAALANLIKSGIPVADVSFTPDPPLDLDASARSSGACCVVDCGIAPGLSHILVAAAHRELGALDSARIWVGGIPQDPPPAFRHAIYFNPHDLIAEYVRPARARVGGRGVAPAPMEAEFESFADAELGDLQAFLSDGLRSLLGSFPQVPEMSELTLRWPGHLETMRTLWKLGVFHHDEASHQLGRVLVDRYPAEQHPDVLIMVVEAARGKERRTWRLIDRRREGQSAMSRTTGYTTAAVAMLLARKQFTDPGVHAPERLGASPQLTRTIIDDLAARGISISAPQAVHA